MSRPFLLIQARNPSDPMREHEVACFLRVMRVGAEELRVVNALETLPDRRDIDACAGVVVGGSGDYSSLDEHRWIQALVDFSRHELVGGRTPVLASCFGFQILVVALGGAMIRDHANTEMGTFDLELTEAGLADPLFGPLGRRFTAQLGHKDRAALLPAGVHNYASSARCPVQALRVGDLPVWATQFHPELQRSDLRLRYLHYRDLYLPQGVPRLPPEDDPFLRSLRSSREVCELPARFVAWVRERERGLPRPLSSPGGRRGSAPGHVPRRPRSGGSEENP